MTMFEKVYSLVIASTMFISPGFGQETEEGGEEESGGREMFTSVDVSYSKDEGNTNYKSLYYGLDFTLIGDAGIITDTEFLFSFYRSDDQLDGESFTDDQSLILKFDLWANQRISPFLFLQKSFDKTIGLEDRLNYGIGAKVGLFKGLSISYAFLAESETYGVAVVSDSTLTPADGYYYYEDYYAYDYTTVDSTSEFFRHSIRPKFKKKFFDDNILFDYRFYFKPKVDDFEDYLLEHEVKLSISTFYELLNIDLNYSNKFNARYKDSEIINAETGEFYKDTDENISIGLSFMF